MGDTKKSREPEEGWDVRVGRDTFVSILVSYEHHSRVFINPKWRFSGLQHSSSDRWYQYRTGQRGVPDISFEDLKKVSDEGVAEGKFSFLMFTVF